MTWTKIGEWVRASGLRQEWTPGMNGGAIQALKDKGEIEKTGGLYRVVASSELSAAEFGASSYEPSNEPSEGVVGHDSVALIPCYGLNWDRNQIEWDRKPQLLGSPRDDNSTKVNSLNNSGCMFCTNGPTSPMLDAPRKATCTSGYFVTRRILRKGGSTGFRGLAYSRSVRTRSLSVHEKHLDMKQAIKAMEAILIEILSPPFNKNRGEFLGTRYRQVRVVDERSADQFRDALARK